MILPHTHTHTNTVEHFNHNKNYLENNHSLSFLTSHDFNNKKTKLFFLKNISFLCSLPISRSCHPTALTHSLSTASPPLSHCPLSTALCFCFETISYQRIHSFLDVFVNHTTTPLAFEPYNLWAKGKTKSSVLYTHNIYIYIYVIWIHSKFRLWQIFKCAHHIQIQFRQPSVTLCAKSVQYRFW